MGKDIEDVTGEKVTGNGLPAYETSSHGERRGSAIGPEVLAGDVFEGHTQSTQRGLKSRHAQMIALGGTIGTGLFVGSGQTLARGGPAFILACFCTISFMVFCVVTAIVEIATWLPTPGSSMNLFGYRYVSRSMGFALGWLYFYSLGILVPYEITAAAIVIDYWETPVNIAVWITIMLVVIVALNALPVRFYGETEFWFASTKVIMMLGLMLVSLVIFFGGGPAGDRLGFRYWRDPGAANTYLASGDLGRFIALLSTLTLSAFPFVFAPELLVVTGGEMQNPRRNLPVAARRYIYRLIFFYIGCVLCIGVIVPSDDPLLTNGGVGAGSSPFVIGMKRNGIKALDSVVNAGILISAWSSGNSFLYLSSRSLYAMSLQGSAPKWFGACTKSGVPYRAVAASSLFTALAYLNVGSSASEVFNWFVNLTNTSGFISWICCGIVYLRFRKACITQGISSQLPYHSWIQPYGTYIQMTFFVFLTLINGFDVFWSENWSASSFLTAYIGIPIFLCIYFGHRFAHWKETWAYSPVEVDLHTGLDRVMEEETPPKVQKNKWLKPLTLLWE
ncbi:Amino acid/polyamine transporter I [Botryosphaeria dothidea]|uniref:Amino acid/polyamine transporter I n=1 Tax=Botryosphaeria dothidea TaxID=55169 RepID=A0A8H4J3V9_9PEZI|nr:Amino acid/polyamine transporter I [Botryosphaeria dothidea]